MTEDGATPAKVRDPNSDWETLRRAKLDKPVAVTMPLLTWLNVINSMQSIRCRAGDKNYDRANELGRLARALDAAVKDALAR